MRQNGYKADATDQRPSYLAILEIFSLKVGKNRPKLVKNLWMIQKFFENKFLAQTILNGPIRKVIMVKVKFEDLRFFTTRSTRDISLKIR